jgi:hypothetical protein
MAHDEFVMLVDEEPISLRWLLLAFLGSYDHLLVNRLAVSGVSGQPLVVQQDGGPNAIRDGVSVTGSSRHGRPCRGPSC